MRAGASVALPPLLLALLLLCATAAPSAAQRRDPTPDANLFAWRTLSTSADAALEQQAVNLCLKGNSVAGIWVALTKTVWASAGMSSCVAWTYTPGRIDYIRVYSHEKDANGDPVYADFGSGPKSGFDGPRQEGYWLALEPFETIKRISLRGNGFGGNAARLGAIRFETTTTTLDLDSWVDVPSGCKCQASDAYRQKPTFACPTSDRPATMTGQADTETPGLLGSGVFCGFYGTVSPSGAGTPTGIREIAPIFLNWVTRSVVRNVQYTPGWQAALGPLSPQTAASVRIDNRQGRAATVTLKLSDTTVDSATASLISGTTLVEEKGVSVSLALPKGKWFSGSGADLTKSGVWDTGTTETKGTTRDTSTAAGSTIKTTVGAGAWTQVVFANYKSSYDVAFTADMALTVENRRLGKPYQISTLAFNTSGRVAGVSTSATQYTLCDLNAAGECPQIPTDNPVPPPPDPTAGVPLASSFSDADLLRSFFVSTPVEGGGNGGSLGNYGFRRCVEEGKYLYRIEALNSGADWASSLRLWYKTGTAGDPPVAVTVGASATGSAPITNSCDFARDDLIVSAISWDNGRCKPYQTWTECRWGKTEFKIRRASTGKLDTCTISALTFKAGGAKRFMGPSQVQNIGSGRLCGVTARAGADIDAIGWIFMRTVTKFETNVQTTTSPGELTPPGYDTSASTAVDNRGHSYSVEAGITPFTLTETLKQTWEETASSAYSSKLQTSVTGSLFEILKVGYKYGSSYTTSTKTVTGGAISKSTSTEVSYTTEVPPNGCTYLRTRQYKNTDDFATWSGTAALTFDNGKRLALPVAGTSTFQSANVYEIEPSDCSIVVGGPVALRPKPGKQPTQLGVRPPRDTTGLSLLRQLAADYRLPLASLRKWNPKLPSRLARGVKYTIFLAPPSPPPRIPPRHMHPRGSGD